MRVTMDDFRPSYVQAADALRSEIKSGLLKPGQRLPSVRELSDRFGIAPATIQNALRLLRDEGLIFSSSTRGYFVREELPEDTPADPNAKASPEYLVIMKHITAIEQVVQGLSDRLRQLEELVDAELQPQPRGSQ
jgi:GntR family transcriptional regulator